jgi:hypothetical protein
MILFLVGWKLLRAVFPLGLPNVDDSYVDGSSNGIMRYQSGGKTSPTSSWTSSQCFGKCIRTPAKRDQ